MQWVYDGQMGTKTTMIQNRRYLGNKFRLLGFIRRVVETHCTDVEVVADIFSGTGAVASAFTDKILITNDILYSNYLCNLAWFGCEAERPKVLAGLIGAYNAEVNLGRNYMTDNFADTYFGHEDCARIGYVRDDIESRYKNGFINERERAILVTALLYAMDRVANTCGHYDSYRRGITSYRRMEIHLPEVPLKNSDANRCFNEDANWLVRKIRADLVYIDPPYNSRQYSDTYHLLENVARWEKPKVYGVARKMNRDKIKSDYCTGRAAAAFEDLIENIDARYILFSYNNMAQKGNARSNARISDDKIFRILGNKGEVKVFSKKYRAFSAGKSDIPQNEERLFLCSVQRGGQI